MTPVFGVKEILADGHSHAEQEIALLGWVWDRFEHCAIYDHDSVIATNHPDNKVGICLRGNLPKRPTTRGDGPLHRVHVRVAGKFHWQPKSYSWPAWIGVRSIEHLPEPQSDAAPTQNEA